MTHEIGDCVAHTNHREVRALLAFVDPSAIILRRIVGFGVPSQDPQMPRRGAGTPLVRALPHVVVCMRCACRVHVESGHEL